MDMVENKNAVSRCMARVQRWKVPPNWSRCQWLEEASAQAELAAIACQTMDKSVPAPGILNTYDNRIHNSVLHRYRQEWSFARHCGLTVVREPVEKDDPEDESAAMLPSIPNALGKLSEPDRRLIEMLYWKHCSESQVAADMGVSQQAISKRKRRILSTLSAVLKHENFSIYRL